MMTETVVKRAKKKNGHLRIDAAANRTRVYRWYMDNPGGRAIECARSIGLSQINTNKHVRAIRAGWRPE